MSLKLLRHFKFCFSILKLIAVLEWLEDFDTLDLILLWWRFMVRIFESCGINSGLKTFAQLFECIDFTSFDSRFYRYWSDYIDGIRGISNHFDVAFRGAAWWTRRVCLLSLAYLVRPIWSAWGWLVEISNDFLTLSHNTMLSYRSLCWSNLRSLIEFATFCHLWGPTWSHLWIIQILQFWKL